MHTCGSNELNRKTSYRILNRLKNQCIANAFIDAMIIMCITH